MGKSRKLKNKLKNFYLLLFLYRRTMIFLNFIKRLYYKLVYLFYKNRLAENHDWTVLNGPFRGMKYISSTTGSQWLPKVIGCYEEPLHDVINDVLHYRYNRIIDIGCAEGYYAVGFKIYSQGTEVIACDINEDAIRFAKESAIINEADIKFLGEVSTSDLQNLIKDKTLLFVDIEGAEIDILDPILCPRLKECDIICEVHNFIDPSIEKTLIERFEITHSVEIIHDYKGRLSKYFDKNGVNFSKFDLKICGDENRSVSDMTWLKLVSKIND